MKIFLVPSSEEEFRTRRIVLFGQGLVGGAVADALIEGGAPLPDHIAYDWDNQLSRKAIRTNLITACTKPERIDLVWAAGRAGFASSVEQMAAEVSTFSEVLELGHALADKDCAVRVHLVSSAGGLFENQTDVKQDSLPQARRPYGHAKMLQETALVDSGLAHSIYRLSSVYGYRPGGRLGLISALISNALAGDPTVITGHFETRRDYIYAPDIGAFISNEVLSIRPSCGTWLLASGHSPTISEVVDLVRNVMRVPVPLQQDPAPANSANMSFDVATIADNLTSVPLAEGIYQTFLSIKAHRAKS